MTDQFALKPAPPSSDHTAWLERCLDELSGKPALGWLCWPVAPRPLERLLSAAPGGEHVLFAKGDSSGVAGFGRAATLSATGDRRFVALCQQARALFERLVVRSAPGAEDRAPVVLGGFAFRAGGASSALWSSFGDARFVLPDVTYALEGSRAWLALAVSGERLAWRSERDALHERVLATTRALGTEPAPPEQFAGTGPGLAIDARARSDFLEAVESVRGAIAREEVEKVVLSRRWVLELPRRPRALDVLDRLRREAAESTRFVVDLEGRVFVGASPERLIRKRAEVAQTEALAGTIRADGGQRAAELLRSAKDLMEHRLVVRELLRVLGPLTGPLAVPAEPEVRSLRDMLHLSTPIEGRLREPLHVLDLVARLHPTPAVGGVPTERALSMIAEHEATERGWYSGPIGWFDAKGDGDFVVALRAALLDGETAYLYAGAGIVADSVAEQELAETRLKLTRMLSALGAL